MTEIEATDTAGGTINEVQTVTVSNATAGTFRLSYGSEQTAALAYNASAGDVDTALEALTLIDTVTVTGSAGGPYTITFTGSHSGLNVTQLTADATYLTSGSVNRTLSYVYDVASQLASTSDADSSYAYTYDNLSRVLTVSNSGTSGVPIVVLTSAYNANSMRTSLSATKGGTADFLNTYSFDNLNRLTRVDQTGNGGATVADKRVNFAYNAIGQFTSIDRNYKNAGTWTEVATSTFTYDTLNRLTALDHKKGVTDIANYDWTFDAMDRVTQLSGPDGTSDYTYDKESQLVGADHSFQTDESYTLDATGNRTNGSYTVGTNNRMTSDGTYNYTYDNEGNRATRTKISDSSITEYTWDHRNRLTKVVERATGSGGAITKQTDFKYDVFGRRISKSADADGAGGGTAVISRYVYDGDNIALQFDGSNNLTHRYLHGPAVDQILADEDALNAILWPLADNLGTVRDLVNDAGTVQNHITYDAFGKVMAETNSAIDSIYGYTGRERDEETGLMYYRARYYDAATGRFINNDPIGYTAGETNLSQYVGNDPTNAVDPTGLGEVPAPQGTMTTHGATQHGKTNDWGYPAFLGLKVAVAVYDDSETYKTYGARREVSAEFLVADYGGAAINASSFDEMLEKLKLHVKNVGLIDELNVLDHGDEVGQTLSTEPLGTPSGYITPEQWVQIQPLLAPGAQINLYGCQVGCNEEYCQATANSALATVNANDFLITHWGEDAWFDVITVDGNWKQWDPETGTKAGQAAKKVIAAGVGAAAGGAAGNANNGLP